MFILEVLVAVAVLAAVALLAAGRFDGLAEETPDDPDVGVPPDRPLRSTDVPRLRFRLAIRGYRMSDVDAAMAAVQEALRMNETQPVPAPSPTPAPLPPPTPHPPFEPEPVHPSPPTPPTPEPLPQPEPPLAEPAADPAPVDVQPADVQPADVPPGDPQPAPSSWQLPHPPGP